MPLWKPFPQWKDKEVFILGGGTSLSSFDFSLLKDELVLGCNDAYLLGKDVVDACIFGDKKWWDVHKDKLKEFKNPIFTNVPELVVDPPENVNCIIRRNKGMSRTELGWNHNTGAAAINLALMLGAKKIYLLGFDMKLGSNGKSNYYENNIDKPTKEVYPRFLTGFSHVYYAKQNLWPEVSIYNVTNDSNLDIFQKLPFDSFWKERNEQCLNGCKKTTPPLQLSPSASMQQQEQ